MTTVSACWATSRSKPIVGAVPLLGDVFDVAFKANRRNLRPARRSPSHATAAPRDPRGVLRLASLLIVATVLALLVATMLLTLAIYHAFVG